MAASAIRADFTLCPTLVKIFIVIMRRMVTMVGRRVIVTSRMVKITIVVTMIRRRIMTTGRIGRMMIALSKIIVKLRLMRMLDHQRWWWG